MAGALGEAPGSRLASCLIDQNTGDPAEDLMSEDRAKRLPQRRQAPQPASAVSRPTAPASRAASPWVPARSPGTLAGCAGGVRHVILELIGLEEEPGLTASKTPKEALFRTVQDPVRATAIPEGIALMNGR